MPSTSRTLRIVAVSVLLLGSCTSTPPVSPSPPPASPSAPSASPSPPSPSAIRVQPAAALLTAVGQTAKLTAQLGVADGGENVTWNSSDPGVASVASDGTVLAKSIGTTLVVASVADLHSEPAYVTVAEPVDGAVLINDSQVVGAPTVVDEGAPPTGDNPYEIVLRGVPGPAVGAILIDTEEMSVAGRVLSVVPEGSDERVRLAIVPPTELFTNFRFADTVDLSSGPFEIPADLAEQYDLAQTGSSISFTPKPVSNGVQSDFVLARAIDRAVHGPAVAAAAQGTRALPAPPPFKECEAEAGFGSGLPLPLALSSPPSFTITLAGQALREATPQGTNYVLRGTPSFKFTSELEVTSAFEVKVECRVTLVRKPFRVPGWAGLFFGGDVEFGVGFEVGGKVTLFSAKVGGSAEIDPTIEARLACPTGSPCALQGSVTATSELTPTLEAPSLNQLQFEPSVNLFAFMSLEAGNADLEALQFEAIDVTAGVELGAGLSLETLQMANPDPEGGRSKYELAFKGKVGPGLKLGEFLRHLGLSSVVPLELSFEAPLGESPTGTVSADKERYLPGEQVTINVILDGASTRFPNGGLYNVDKVVVLRSTGLSVQALATATATTGQTDFTLVFAAPGLLNAEELSAFVVTSLLPLDPPKLEIGQATPPGIAPGTYAGIVTVTIHGDSRDNDNVGNSTDATFIFDLRVTVDRQAMPTLTTGTVTADLLARENGEGCKSVITFSGSGSRPTVTWSEINQVGGLSATVTGNYREEKRCSGGSTDTDTGRVSFDVPDIVPWIPEFSPDGRLVALVWNGTRRGDARIGVGESDVMATATGRLELVP